jgi:hypothetical protein
VFDSSFSVGDAITWWTDSHGQGLPPDDPEAVRRTGTITRVHQDPSDDSRVVAYSVECQGVLGSYVVTVRPDWHHQPTLVDQGS